MSSRPPGGTGRIRRRARAGFALPAVLAVTGVVTLIFLVAITALATLTAEARAARDRIRFMQSVMTAEATVTYAALTEPIGLQGFNVGAPRAVGVGEEAAAGPVGGLEPTLIALDDRPYTFLPTDRVGAAAGAADGVEIRLLDQNGMINLAVLSDPQHDRLMAALGVPAGVGRALVARYADYVDSDDLRVVNGAESADYDGVGPANRFLLRPVEWLSILEARGAVRPDRWRILRRQLAADIVGGFNINTATPEALMIQFGLDAAGAEAVVRAREAEPLVSLDAAAGAGANLGVADLEQVNTFPSSRFFFTLRDRRSPWTYRGRVVLTPAGVERPFWIDQTELTEAPAGAAPLQADAPEFPYTPG